MPYTLTPGSISHGTLRTQDLLEACAHEIGKLERTCEDTTCYAHLTIRRIHSEALAYADVLENGEEDDSDEYTMEDRAAECLEECIDLLQDCVPPYCYFGMHEGDGSDLGCWPHTGAIEDGLEDGSLVRISDPNELDTLPMDTQGAVYVNDHGNMTVYMPKRTWESAIDIV